MRAKEEEREFGRSEFEAVLDWRRELFLGMGFDMIEAEALSHSPIADTRQVGRVLQQGCSHKLAARIYRA